MISRRAGLAPLSAIAVVILVLAACTHRPASLPPPAFPAAQPLTGLRVTLTWNGAADLDLYLTGPSWETLYFGNTPSSGGTLEHDVRCADIAPSTGDPPLESATFAEPAGGHYRIGVDYMEACSGRDDPQPYRLLVEYGGKRHELVAVARHHEFVPIVLEFDLRKTDRSGPLDLEVAPKPEGKP